MATAVYAWSMRDGDFKNTKLKIHFLLVDRYFAIATQWPGEEPTWLTRRLVNVEEAHTYAINHTNMLEKAGDTMEHGPVAFHFLGEITDFDEYVGRDTVSARLDHLLDEAMINGLVGEVIP